LWRSPRCCSAALGSRATRAPSDRPERDPAVPRHPRPGRAPHGRINAARDHGCMSMFLPHVFAPLAPPASAGLLGRPPPPSHPETAPVWPRTAKFTVAQANKRQRNGAWEGWRRSDAASEAQRQKGVALFGGPAFRGARPAAAAGARRPSPAAATSTRSALATWDARLPWLARRDDAPWAIATGRLRAWGRATRSYTAAEGGGGRRRAADEAEMASRRM